jgi:CRISPR system Cascade subunit CasD
MGCLLLQLIGPLQSWGIGSRFGNRDSGREPSKSGVLGLLASAQGRDRGTDLSDLRALTMGLRVDREGVPLRDFQTAGGGSFRGLPYGVAKADGSPLTRGNADKATVVSVRWYLSDGAFLIALGASEESADPGLLDRLASALRRPVYPLFLGRKSCPPSAPILIGIREGSPEEVLRREPRIAPFPGAEETPLRLVLECAPEEGMPRTDVPLSFDPLRRRYGVRYVRTDWCEPPRCTSGTGRSGLPGTVEESEGFREHGSDASAAEPAEEGSRCFSRS